MSYDIRLKDPITGATLQAEGKHEITGGTYCVGGTPDLWLNITWNYGTHFYRVLGVDGIRSIYGKTGAESLLILQAAVEKLGDDVDADYWRATEGNAKRALLGLIALARLRPDGVWDGD
jgi:hypothetical protein